MTDMLAARSLTGRVFAHLRGEILAGRVPPGSKLSPSEICGEQKVSLNVVREALNRLTGEGLVQALPQQGFVVAYASVDDLLDLTNTRTVVETSALRRSIEVGNLAWESELVAAHHQLTGTPFVAADRPTDITPEWMTAHNNFHRATMSGCGMHRLMGIVAALADSALMYRHWSQRFDTSQRDIASEHRAIYEATIARDAERACALHRDHIERTAQIVIKAMSPT